jgi:hypothetical protein
MACSLDAVGAVGLIGLGEGGGPDLESRWHCVEHICCRPGSWAGFSVLFEFMFLSGPPGLLSSCKGRIQLTSGLHQWLVAPALNCMLLAALPIALHALPLPQAGCEQPAAASHSH